MAVRHAQKRGANGYAALRMLLEDATLADHARPTLGCYLVSHVAARSGDEVAAGLLLRHQVQLVDQLSTVEGQLLHGMGRQQLIKVDGGHDEGGTPWHTLTCDLRHNRAHKAQLSIRTEEHHRACC